MVKVDSMALFILMENAKIFLADIQQRRDNGEECGNLETEAWLQSAIDKAQHVAGIARKETDEI